LHRTRVVGWVFLALLLCLSGAGRATLGEREEQIANDRVALHLEKTETKSLDRYQYQILSSNDLEVKEYINPTTNVIFGVTWRGRQMPDLLVLLGFDPSVIKGPNVYRSLRYSRIETPTIILEMQGRPGLYFGRAVRLDALPSNVSPSEVVP
jgi:hypothetical protein